MHNGGTILSRRNTYRVNLRAIPVGRVLWCSESGRVDYPDEDYLNETHWDSDIDHPYQFSR